MGSYSQILNNIRHYKFPAIFLNFLRYRWSTTIKQIIDEFPV